MDAQEIDALLARYTAAEQRITANLVEFDDHPTYTLLSAGDLSGDTAVRLGPLVAAVPKLWDWLHALGIVLSEARDIRAEGRLNGDRREALNGLLSGSSVMVDTATTPLTERDLTSAATSEQRVTIEQLLTMMRERYEPIRDGVADIDAIWRDVLPRADAASTTLQRLRADLSELGLDDAAVVDAETLLATTQSAAFDDPLALGADAGEALDAAVARATTTVAKLRQGKDGLDDDLGSLETVLADLRVLRARAAAAWSETRAKVAGPQGMRHPPAGGVIDGLGGLAEQADALQAGPDRSWQMRRADLDAWMATAERLRAQLRRAEEVNRAPLARRDELRGLLAAYRVKAASVGLAERPDLVDLADDAHNELFTSPSDLQRAGELVAGYGAAMVNGEGASR